MDFSCKHIEYSIYNIQWNHLLVHTDGIPTLNKMERAFRAHYETWTKASFQNIYKENFIQDFEHLYRFVRLSIKEI
jgi:hypothetical protein